MKECMVFILDPFGRGGGWDDFVGCTNSVDDVVNMIIRHGPDRMIVQLVDYEMKTLIFNRKINISRASRNSIKKYLNQMLTEYYMSLDYLVEVEKIPDEEGGGYCARMPQFGYSMLGDGNTPEAAFQSLKQCKRMMFREWIDGGVEIPEPANCTVTRDLLPGENIVIDRKTHTDFRQKEGVS